MSSCELGTRPTEHGESTDDHKDDGAQNVNYQEKYSSPKAKRHITSVSNNPDQSCLVNKKVSPFKFRTHLTLDEM